MSADEIHDEWPVELQTVEWKKTLSERREGLEALCGMANTDLGKGVVLFGIAPDGRACGIEPGDHDKAQRSIVRALRTNFDPPPTCSVELVDCEGARLLLLSIVRPRELPYLEYNGHAYISEGSTRRRLSDTEKQQLVKRRSRELHPGPWKCDRCNTYVGMLNCVTFTNQGPVKSYDCECGGQFWPV